MKQECYCGSGTDFEKCCKPYLLGDAIPETAEQLMRSRYTAYTLKDDAYIIKTWHSKTRPSKKQLEDGKIKWHRLKVIESISGGAEDKTGEVLFEAIYKINGKAHKHIEHSVFEKEAGQWRYLDVKPEAP